MLKLKIAILSILFFSLCSCSLPIYVTKESNNDKTIYANIPGKSNYEIKKLTIYKLGREIGELYYDGGIVTLTLLNGNKIKLYQQHQYSGVKKITQSFDDKIIRVYHWSTSLFTSEERITELDLDKLAAKTYKLKNVPIDPDRRLEIAYSNIDIANGVDIKEARLLAEAYFATYISACGGVSPNPPINKGDSWEFETKFGVVATLYDPIIVNKKTGKIACTKGPKVEPFK